MKFTTTEKLKQELILDGYTYQRIRRSEEKVFWRCSKARTVEKCKATCTTSGMETYDTVLNKT